MQRDRQVLGQAGGRAWVDAQERCLRGWRGLLRAEVRRKEDVGEDEG